MIFKRKRNLFNRITSLFLIIALIIHVFELFSGNSSLLFFSSQTLLLILIFCENIETEYMFHPNEFQIKWFFMPLKKICYIDIKKVELVNDFLGKNNQSVVVSYKSRKYKLERNITVNPVDPISFNDELGKRTKLVI